MMKTGKPALQGAKASGSSAESSLTYPNSSLKVPVSPQSSQSKSKLNRFKMAASILKHCSSVASPRPPEASNGLPNGLLPGTSDERSGEKSCQRKMFPKDIADFGLYQKCHRGVAEDASGAGDISRNMYSLSEEAGDSESLNTDEKEAEKDEKGLSETVKEGKDAAKETKNEKSGVLNTTKGSDTGEDKETEAEEKETLPNSDSVTAECISESSRKEA